MLQSQGERITMLEHKIDVLERELRELRNSFFTLNWLICHQRATVQSPDIRPPWFVGEPVVAPFKLPMPPMCQQATRPEDNQYR